MDEAPVISRRVIESAAVVESGGVVVLGGLAETNRTHERNGLPFLKALGPAAGRLNEGDEEKRLYVVLRVVESSEAKSIP